MAYERITLDILISDELRDLLTQIEGDSEVAKLLLKKRHRKEDLVDSPVNYISMSIEDKGKISYLTNDRIAKLDADSLWTSPSRYKSKPGGFISKVFKNISSKEVEKFSNLFKAITNKPSFRFELVSGDKIKEYYHEDSYSSDEKGSLGASCMKHGNCQKFFGIYTDNKEVSMLVMFNDKDNLIGRALLWDFQEHKIMDRIYAKNDEEFSFYFKKWATENNYLYKSEQNWYNTLNFENLNVKQHELLLEIKIENMPRRFPYLDTFKFLDSDNNVITNFITPTTSCIMSATNGEYNDSDSLRFDGINRVYRYKNESVYLEYRDIYTVRENVHHSRYNDCYIARTEAVWDNIIEDYIFTGDYASNNKDIVSQSREQILKDREEESTQNTNTQTITPSGGLVDTHMSMIDDLLGDYRMSSSYIRASMARIDVGNDGEIRWRHDFDYNPELPF